MSVRPGRVGALMVLDYALVVVTLTSVSCVRGFRGAIVNLNSYDRQHFFMIREFYSAE